MLADDDVCVLSYARTPLGSFGGQLSTFTAVELGTLAVTSALSKSHLHPSSVDEVFLGNVLSAGLGQAPARQVALGANIPNTVPCTTVNKVCASGMKAVALGAGQIKLGAAQVVVVGGFESMSNVPYYAPSNRFGTKFGHSQLLDGLAYDGLEDAYSHSKMGDSAELCAATHHYTRAMQDAYTHTSYARALQATKDGKFENEIVGIALIKKKGNKDKQILSTDEECGARPITPASLAAMRTAGFTPPTTDAAPTVTAGSSSTLSDGAAALVLCSGLFAKQNGAVVLAVLRGWADTAKEPKWFTTAPSEAIPKALLHAGVQLKDVDYFEINEAFSVVAMVNRDLLHIAPTQLNVYGGAVSLGHPLGCSGARILCTLLSVLENEGGRIGCAGICNGGGGASAMVVEKWKRRSGSGARSKL